MSVCLFLSVSLFWYVYAYILVAVFRFDVYAPLFGYDDGLLLPKEVWFRTEAREFQRKEGEAGFVGDNFGYFRTKVVEFWICHSHGTGGGHQDFSSIWTGRRWRDPLGISRESAAQDLGASITPRRKANVVPV